MIIFFMIIYRTNKFHKVAVWIMKHRDAHLASERGRRLAESFTLACFNRANAASMFSTRRVR